MYDQQVMDLLNKYNSDYTIPNFPSTSEQSRINLYLSSFSFDRPEVRGVFLFANNGILFSNLSVESVLPYWERQRNEVWMKSVVEADGKAILIAPHVGNYYRNRSDQVFSIARLIKEPYSQRSIGMIKIDLSPQVFERILSSVSLTTNSKLIVVNNEDEQFYPITSPSNNHVLSENKEVALQGADYIRQEQVSHLTGLKFIGLLSLNDLQEEANIVVRFILYTLGISILLSMILSFVFSKRLTTAIKHLHAKMKRVQNGDFEGKAEFITNDEIGYLARGFNSMVTEINRLVNEVFETKVREREAELTALQSQINPHFLYNTLELISMMAIENKQYDISDVAASLGKQLRYTVDKQQRPVKLREEFHFVEAFLRIHEVRRGERLQVCVQADEAVLEVLVPKLIIQPLVENALEHGLQDGGGRIEVKAALIGEVVNIWVTDNGVGMTSEKLDQMMKSLHNDTNTGQGDLEGEKFGQIRKGFALRNVHQRLRLLYGKAYGLDIVSKDARGSTFRLTLPYEKTSSFLDAHERGSDYE
ncbi:sensor histidine kinase [Paenibacillus roseipurpureus]|uniref:Sensor histidine kinase n=1 Tax=Paenibacillus roseopurpureus TaxID=2918901 RepID=A0AA96RJ82_9BACL|nr:sensor histidine kinase [Paenibacillus sp. MBLB1832]WNR42876.1 sensor histidine kinase [Paenibacillus sp. MBLB1832]